MNWSAINTGRQQESPVFRHGVSKQKPRKINSVLFQAMIFETAFQNLVVLIYVVKTDLFCFMRSAFLLYITLISCHNYLNI